MRLDGQQQIQLTTVLGDGFGTAGELDELTSFYLNHALVDITPPQPRPDMIREVIRWAARRDVLGDLIWGAKKLRPRNKLIHQYFEFFFHLVSKEALPGALQEYVVPGNQLFDIASWIQRLNELIRRVCKIHVGPGKYGTGFLVGPDVVLTNHHVVRPLLSGKLPPEAIRFQFDYTTLEAQGTFHRLSRDWLIDSSPHDPVDEEPQPKSRLPGPANLDHALLRLERGAGPDQLGGSNRGFIELPKAPSPLNPHEGLLILQHPKGEQLQCALDTQAIIDPDNGNQTRLTYRTNTVEGSSGAPCFNMKLELVALHHSGDPGFTPHYNEGIPISAIRSRLEEKKLLGALGTA